MRARSIGARTFPSAATLANQEAAAGCGTGLRITRSCGLESPRVTPRLINTPLQRGGRGTGNAGNRFNGFSRASETVETVSSAFGVNPTPLKWGVNEMGNSAGVQRYEISRTGVRGFTLIELLVVIAIIGLLAGLAVPVVNNFKPNVTAGGTRQLLDDVARARQFAISQRTTVFMVFVPTNFWGDPAYGSNWTPADNSKAQRLLDKQLVAYNFVARRTPGDQPGRATPHYLASWKALPEGVYIPPEKFLPRNPNLPVMNIFTNNNVGNPVLSMRIFGFNTTTNVPFPSDETKPSNNANRPYIALPYIAFNYLGQLAVNQNEFIPLSKGAVIYQRDPATGGGKAAPPAVVETPAGNTSNAFNVVSIDWLTGRAHLERQQIQ